ncbi:tRNA (guanosine(37)-N1)-methyltransferase TrmD [Weissella paramesenteroides]|jgi:tRNA (guanine37-N1)-methyltransferase|uniref:tRNA (guanine-N(1)-)-methyltransferase n=1 Tax=Weissella paramesenteroides TaxID=1249 RepID=A0ABD4XJ39_WEIPA|nr:tRNA (guanosine(37)-N1)-methyltransferase TrmD [Weissella paramesenteroides]KAA8439107.1 tRNA (guanosine(37)-N1)-methyltransferase TrmD [Weissella paramesenteroides]KAA8440185.1 tRNA (guanosine(37)-N1)-methyltransferase TrmD [Weissella paramesenteroides]KAA8443904.1 tRNA (guanosine(37)-N1)-methyltransferase TrmD [Weissella paramesenteroides]KAA8446385.1 tRNA (guanosine(37)-N1)-methyltransferase TrmD [Weissella paramesenteroides]KAA8451455.1 tRNA (guanosine(37)-N1)-methyltransferase TrmD [We
MRIDVLSLFPNMFAPMRESIIGKTVERGLVDFNVTDFRNYTDNKHHKVDDEIYGGGQGMLLMPQPLFDAMDAVEKEAGNRGRVILMDPAGKTFNQSIAEELAKEEHLTIIAGHYEGYDERIRTLVDDEISLGDFVLTGGELGAMTVIDATVRLLDEALGDERSAVDESFSTGLLEYPQYTRPADFRGLKVPDVLLSGHHANIAKWKHKEALRRTYQRRPDLLADYVLTTEDQKLLKEIKQEEQNN